jgi:hypothetical protein
MGGKCCDNVANQKLKKLIKKVEDVDEDVLLTRKIQWKIIFILGCTEMIKSCI